MPACAEHHIVKAACYLVPKPFHAFAVRSEEPRHAEAARAPYGGVHVVRTKFLDAPALDGLAALGMSRMGVRAFSDIDYAPVTPEELAGAASSVGNVVGGIAAGLQATGLLGPALEDYRRRVDARIDYLASCGAGFHNDVSGHWTACLFWNLALVASDVEFVMPHAGIRLALAPGDLLVFDQTMAHGLCRPRDQGRARPGSFESGDGCHQIFLSGELPLADAQWLAIGSPWLPVEAHAQALDLTAAEFDDQTGAIKRLHSLRHCMLRSSSYVDQAAG
jgi:hypothetical protein